MDFQRLVNLYEDLEQTSSGNRIREILADFLKKTPPEELARVAYLTLGQISSDYESTVLGMAEKSVLKAIATASGQESLKIKKIMQETGDAGLTAEKVLQQKPRTLIPVGKLTVKELFDKLHQIVEMGGTGSQEKKTNLLVSLLQKSPAKGAKYITRIVLGTLRLGVAEMTVLDALALAFTGEKKNKEQLEKAYNICPDVGIIAETIAKKGGLKGLEKIDVHVGRPIKMMLAQRVKEMAKILEKIPDKFTVEAKYDGERIQAHKNKNGKIVLFSRRLENITNQFPDLVEYLKKAISKKEYVVEGEVIAVKGDQPLPFQKLMQRRRKHDIEKYVKEIPVKLKLFDLLYLDGKSYLNKPYLEREETLKKIVYPNKEIVLTERIVTEDLKELDKFFKKMLKEGYEGVIIKAHQGEYQAGTRGWNWIKWKKDYAQEMVDTFDLVVVGAFHGRGRRSGTYGALLCAAYDHKKDEFVTACKLGSGLTDQMLAELPQKLKKHEVSKKPARVIVKKEMVPDVWFTPKVVVEVLAAEITKSPFHTLGLALRFPRFVRFREEKKAEQATTSQEIQEMA